MGFLPFTARRGWSWSWCWCLNPSARLWGDLAENKCFPSTYCLTNMLMIPGKEGSFCQKSHLEILNNQVDYIWRKKIKKIIKVRHFIIILFKFFSDHYHSENIQICVPVSSQSTETIWRGRAILWPLYICMPMPQMILTKLYICIMYPAKYGDQEC